MKKLTLLAHHGFKGQVLAGLQKLGICHIEQTKPENTQYVDELQQHMLRLEVQRNTLAEYQALHQVNLPQSGWKADSSAVLEVLEGMHKEKEAFSALLVNQQQQLEILKHYGDFSPSLLEKLEKSKVKIAFCSCSKPQFTRLETASLALEVLSETKSSVYYAVFYKKGQKFSEAEKRVLANQQEIPRFSMRIIEAEICQTEDYLGDLERSFIEHTKYIGLLSNTIELDRDALAYELARSAMTPDAEGTIYVLSAWVPASACQDLCNYLDHEMLVYFLEEPSVHDEVPVKLKQNGFNSLFQPILKLFSLPHYSELDPTPFFAPFYALFFGLCISDIGYGVIIFIACLFLLVRGKSREIKNYLLLGLVLSVSIMVCGILLDDYFGARLTTEYQHELEKELQSAELGPAEQGTGIFSIARIFAPYAFFSKQADAMMLPMLLGVVQVLLGWGLRVRNQIRHCGWQGFGQPTGNILFLLGLLFWVFPANPVMLGPQFHIGPLPIGALLCSLGAETGRIIFMVGIALILLFNGAEKNRKVWLRPATGLWSLYELGTGLISDILSYLRLFALGLAGALLAESVNAIAWGMIKNANGIIPYIAMLAILLFGHALNFGLGMLSAFVHSLRLQFVEFFKAIEFKGGGIEYNPLRTNHVHMVAQKNKL